MLNATVFPAESVLYDNELTVEHVDTASEGCNFGMTFKSGHVGILDEAKVFINFLSDKEPYVDKLHLVGSDDDFST